MQHVTCIWWKLFTHIFLGLLNTGGDLILGGECFVLRRIDLVFSKDRKGCFDTEFFDANFATMGGHCRLRDGGGGEGGWHLRGDSLA